MKTPNTTAKKRSDKNLKAPFQQKSILKKAQNHKETVSQCKFKNQTNFKKNNKRRQRNKSRSQINPSVSKSWWIRKKERRFRHPKLFEISALKTRKDGKDAIRRKQKDLEYSGRTEE